MLEKLKAITRANSVIDLRDTTLEAFRVLGLSRAFFLAPVGHERSVGRRLTNMGFPEDWEHKYRETDYLNDPLPDIAVRLGAPFRWDALPKDVILNRVETEYLASLKTWGMEEGVCVVAYGPAASVGFVGAAAAAPEGDLSGVDLEMFQIAGQTSFVRYGQLNKAELNYEMSLSNRELDVLHWMAQGKSNSAIAEMLGLSQDTVNTYVKRIFSKLDVFDRTSAVMKGVIRGLVIASDPKIEAAIQARETKRRK